MDPTSGAEAEAFLLEQAGVHHARTLAGLAAHLLEVMAPDLAERHLAERLAADDAREMYRHNELLGTVNRHGRVSLRGELDTESWAVVSSALEPLAKPTISVGPDGRKERDTRAVSQRAADALVELCRRQLSSGELPTSHGYPAHVAVTIGYDTLLAGVGVSLLDTGDAISARDVRRITCDATILPVLLGSDGVPLDVGRAIRVFTKELRRAVELRDLGCAFPGCSRPPSWCNVHHILHWIDHGPTSLDNGVLLCGAHHRVIHRGEWTVHLGRDRRPEFLPPIWLDQQRDPLRNSVHLRC